MYVTHIFMCAFEGTHEHMWNSEVNALRCLSLLVLAWFVESLTECRAQPCMWEGCSVSSWCLLISASWVLGSQGGAPHQALEWVLGMWSQVLKHVWQAFYQLYHLPSIRIFKDNEWRLFLPCFHTQQQTGEKGTQISEYLTHSAPWMLSKSFKHVFVTNDMSYYT